jgi:pimeloyl-ACP methyl ester carboxylesterase
VRVVVAVLGTLLLLYGILVVIAAMSYKRVLYPAPAEAPFVVPANAALVSRSTPLGVPFHGLYFAARGERLTLVLFHGNGETMATSIPRAVDIAASGFGVLLAEYRGYGRSAGSGTPSEEGLYDDGAAALAFLHDAGVPAARVVVWGTSLGTGVASELAANGRAARLVLCTPYTSMRDLAARVSWFVPWRLVMEERFDTLAKAPRIHVPTLVVHGDADEVVPFDMGEAVAHAIEGATFLRVPGGHHNDLYVRDPTLLHRILAFAEK